MGSRRKGRELALQALYLMDLTRLEQGQILKQVFYGQKLDEKTKKFSETLALGAHEKRDFLDKNIIAYSQNWEIRRMAVLDRNILRMGTYELLYELDTPVSVIIDEAVEIAKTFSTHDSGKFVNGILDKIKNERKRLKGKDDGGEKDTGKSKS